MMNDGFFASLSKFAIDIRTPPGLLLWIGLLLFGVGVASGEFGMSNPKLVWGMASLAGSQGWRLLGNVTSSMFDGQRTHTHWSLTKLFFGIVFWLISLSLIAQQVYGWPPKVPHNPFHVQTAIKYLVRCESRRGNYGS